MHWLAMNAPFNAWRIFFYRLRGTRIGKGVRIVQGSFLEESRPWLIELHEDVSIGTNVIIFTHDAIYYLLDNTLPYRYAPVIVKRNALICAGSIILPGVTIGERSVVAPASLVRESVPDGVVVAGNPAQIVMTVEEGLDRYRKKVDLYRKNDLATKYPWRVRSSVG